MAALWQCPKCDRWFRQKNQRHACGTGNRDEVLRDRPESLVRLYAALEEYARSLGPIEIVARERYVLLRSTRIFTDLVIMADAVRIAIHLPKRVEDPIFLKVVNADKKVTHVARLQTERNLERVKRYIKAAYEFSVASPPPARPASASGRTPAK